MGNLDTRSFDTPDLQTADQISAALSSLLPPYVTSTVTFGEESFIDGDGNIILKRYNFADLPPTAILEWLHEIAHLHVDDSVRSQRRITGEDKKALQEALDAEQLQLINSPDDLLRSIESSEESRISAFKAHKLAVLVDELATWEALVSTVLNKAVKSGFNIREHFPDPDMILDYITKMIVGYQKGMGYIFNINTPEGQKFIGQEVRLIQEKLSNIREMLTEFYTL